MIYVTGHSGFIGGAVCEHLAGGEPLVGISRASGFDLGRPETAKLIAEKFGPASWVVHLAGAKGVPESWKEPERIYRENTLPTLGAVELARRTGARILHLSSYVYGIPTRLPIDELHPLAAPNPYAFAKLACEQIVKQHVDRFGIRAVILRPFNLYGPARDSGDVIGHILRQVGGETIQIRDLTPRRDYLHVDDLARLVAVIVAGGATRELAPLEIFNVGQGVSHSVRDVIAVVAQVTGKRFRIENDAVARPNEIPDCYADLARVQQTFPWRPAVDLTEGIRRLLPA